MKVNYKGKFGVKYLFLKLLSSNLEIKETQIFISCTTVITIRTVITLVQKIFPEGRISEFWNTCSRCDVIIPNVKLSVQNVHLRCIFLLLEIVEGFDHWLSWLPYGRVTFKDTCFYRTPLVTHNKRSSILQQTGVIRLWQNSWKKRHAVPVTNIFYIALKYVNMGQGIQEWTK